MNDQTSSQYDPNTQQLTCLGAWDLPHLKQLEMSLNQNKWLSSDEIHIEGHGITQMDSAGAWILLRLQQQLKARNVTTSFVNFSEAHQALLSLVQDKMQVETLSAIPSLSWLERIGKNSIHHLQGMNSYLNFVGKLTIEALRILPNPTHWRFNEIAGTIYRAGYQALPIIALLSLMIGIVITYQMGLQLRSYGANIFIVDLLGLSVLREFGPLITAIMVAGRTGSAFTAQLGMMKINQEIDALDTLGITSAELLLIPRIIGLVIVLPLLMMWANLFGVIGGMIMANNMLNITWYDFLHRFGQVIPLRALIIGLGKAPIFALIIASIGCYQGMRVQGNSESVGINTTRSVVFSIFFIIVADAIFSVIFSKMQL